MSQGNSRFRTSVRTITLLSALGLPMGALSCSFQELKPRNPGPADPGTPGAPAPTAADAEGLFLTINSQVFQPSCKGCHQGASARGGVDLSSNEALLASARRNPGLLLPTNARASKLVLALTSGQMPPQGPPVAASSISAIVAWIQSLGAAPQQTPGASASSAPSTSPTPSATPSSQPTPSDEPDSLTFATVMEAVLGPEKYGCTNCHAGEFAEGGVDLSTYQAAMNSTGDERVIVPGNAAASQLYEAIAENRMPPSGPRVSQADRNLVRRWIEQGALP